MSCENRYGTPCYEFMCGSSENGICTANPPKKNVTKECKDCEKKIKILIRKWIKRECPHICYTCKWKGECDYGKR